MTDQRYPETSHPISASDPLLDPVVDPTTESTDSTWSGADAAGTPVSGSATGTAYSGGPARAESAWADPDAPDSRTEQVKEEGKHVAADAKESAAHVAGAVKDEVRDVASDARQQARRLFDQARTEVRDQGATQQQRAAGGLHSLARELEEMAHGAQERGQSGMATDFASQAATKVHAFAGWLEDREPGDVVEEVRRYARRSPGAFLAGAAALGVVAGRLTRGLTDHDDDAPTQAPRATRSTGDAWAEASDRRTGDLG